MIEPVDLQDVIYGDVARRNWFVFVNEHHAETYVERRPGESANDRNDRAIRRAAAWYAGQGRGDSIGNIHFIITQVCLGSNEVPKDYFKPTVRLKIFC